jgi:hypothetical protein
MTLAEGIVAWIVMSPVIALALGRWIQINR